MTPAEKADELCRKMLYQIEWNAQPSTVKGVAKACALIAVDEILNLEPPELSYMEPFSKSWWDEVKQEIEKL